MIDIFVWLIEKYCKFCFAAFISYYYNIFILNDRYEYSQFEQLNILAS